jgi:hypothetical protein
LLLLASILVRVVDETRDKGDVRVATKLQVESCLFPPLHAFPSLFALCFFFHVFFFLLLAALCDHHHHPPKTRGASRQLSPKNKEKKRARGESNNK